MNEIKIRNLYKKYKNYTALENINLNIQENKIYGLLGNNGAGKSSLLNIINNRIFSTTGEVTLNGDTVFDNEYVQNQMFLMSEVDLYDKKMTVKKIFKWTAAFYGDFNYELAKVLANEFNLNVSKKIGDLSTGYRSIFKLIIALCVPCKFIFLDESVLGLDATHRKRFYDSLIQSYIDNPRTFVISTHLIEEISNILESVIILEKGEVILDEKIDNLYDSYFFISGNKNELDEFINDNTLEIIGEEQLGNYASMTIRKQQGSVDIPKNFETNKFDLQKLFVDLINKGESENETKSSDSI